MRLMALLLCGIVLFPAAVRLQADAITTAQQQLKQVTAQRSTAEQRLAAARQEVAALSLQLQSNRSALAGVQQQTAAMQQEASAREAGLNGNLNSLLTDLQAARTQLGTEQQQFQTQQAAAQARLQQDQADLLRVPVHSPALIVKRIGYDKRRRPIERAMSIYRGDRYDIRMTVRRNLT